MRTSHADSDEALPASSANLYRLLQKFQAARGAVLVSSTATVRIWQCSCISSQLTCGLTVQAMMRHNSSNASNANLEGLLRESSAVREEVVARAPPADSQRQEVVLPPKASLKPSHLVSTWQRWSSVAQELAGKKTQQQLVQVGTIGVVILLRTLLQVCAHVCWQLKQV